MSQQQHDRFARTITQCGRLSLRARLLIVILLPAALLTMLVSLLFVHNNINNANEALLSKISATADFLAPAAEYGVISQDVPVLSGLLKAAFNQPEITAAIIYDNTVKPLSTEGTPRFSEQTAQIILRQPSDTLQTLHKTKTLLCVATPIYFTPVSFDTFDDNQTLNKNTVNTPIGWVYLEIDTSNLLIQQKQTVITVTALLLIGLSAFSLLALRLERYINTPIRAISSAVKQMDSGQLHTRITIDTTIPEIKSLITGFNNMAHTIADSHETMQIRIKEATKKLEWQALHDPLTGLQNRRAFEKNLAHIIAEAKQSSAYTNNILCIVDLDHFKIVNDTCGHAAGDRLLRNLTHLIEESVRKDDTLYRIGGDEFALILHNCKTQQGYQIVDNLRQVIAQYRFNWEEKSFSIGASIGLVAIEKNFTGSIDTIQRAADDACYIAKRTGRNRVVIHNESKNHSRRESDLTQSSKQTK